MTTVPAGPVFPAAVITGLGAVTPFGKGVDAFWGAVMQSRSAFDRIRLFSTEGHRTAVAAGIIDLPTPALRRVEADLLSRADMLGLAAAEEALGHARLLDPATGCAINPARMGVLVGTAAGSILGLEEFFRKRESGLPVPAPLRLLSSFCLAALGVNIAREFCIQGPRRTIATVCSSSALAMAAALELLSAEELDHVLVVGVETLSEVSHAGFNSLRSVAPERCQPFDANRKGLILGEGAGAVLLERPQAAERRGARVFARLAGYGLMTDSHHFTAPQPDGHAIAQTISAALDSAGLAAQDIAYINAHGTGTMLNDAAETRGIQQAFGAYARSIPVSSIKSMIGHQMGAAGILEGIITVKSMQAGVIPPTANLETPDPACGLDYVSDGARSGSCAHALSNSFAFGGSNISLVFAKESGPSASAPRTALQQPMPVITGIGVAAPTGIGKSAFIQALAERANGLSRLAALEEEWAGFAGGYIDTAPLRDSIPASIRRLQNRQAAFLSLALHEAFDDGGLQPAAGWQPAMTYGTAFGCSGNVHRFYTQLLREGPKYTSPLEFNMSVTNAPAALLAQELGLTGPLWVFVADEASWEVSLRWAMLLIRQGRAEQVLVCGAEELSGSILAIHEALGLLRSDTRPGLVLGEGALCMIVEAQERAVRRGARIYGRLKTCALAQNPACAPSQFAFGSELAVQAAAGCLQGSGAVQAPLLFAGADNGIASVDAASADALRAVENLWGGTVVSRNSRAHTGESGIAGGLALAGAILDPQAEPESPALVLTCARGGVWAATFVERGTTGRWQQDIT